MMTHRTSILLFSSLKKEKILIKNAAYIVLCAITVKFEIKQSLTEMSTMA